MELACAPVMKNLYECGYVLEVETQKDTTPIGTIHTVQRQWEYKFKAKTLLDANMCDRTIPVPGKRYRLNSISADAGLIHM